MRSGRSTRRSSDRLTPDKKPCIVCRRKPTHYQERKKGKEQSGTLCKACYHRAVTMKSSQLRTIPGIIDVTRLQRWIGIYPAVIFVMEMRSPGRIRVIISGCVRPVISSSR
ncbi:hypothetical protein [Methanospirillum sp.]|uniref:hypothetical protein n=1 Tax=Methanospirillum sp. TaxID=45200 RepID=UPI00359F1540